MTAPLPEPEMPDSTLTKDIKQWGMFLHLSALSGFVGIPFGNILGPLILWLMKKDEWEFIDEHGKEAVNFQISMLIYLFVSGLLTLIIIGIVMIIALVIFSIVVSVMAALKANEGLTYRYPLTIRFIK